jgi:Flp pilus assembly protein TadG
MLRTLLRPIGRLRRDRRGAVAVMTGLIMASVLSVAGIAVDVGHVLLVQRELQSSVDAAALAGAAKINCCATAGSAASLAVSYSDTGTNLNAVKGYKPTLVSGFPRVVCLNTLKSLNLPCGAPDNGNALQVAEQVNVPLVFAALVGWKSMTVTAMSTASFGGQPVPLDIVFVIDTTASMATSNNSCGSNMTRLDCAKLGAQSVLKMLNQSVDSVALYVFPGLSSTYKDSKGNAAPVGTLVGYEYCATTPPSMGQDMLAKYNASPAYQILPFASDYQVAGSSPVTLNTTSSNLVKALGGASSCVQPRGSDSALGGLQDPGGVKTFYADAVTAAHTYLTASGRANVQKVIILLSDGDAQSDTAPNPVNQCHQAITAAAAATSAGTWVYTMAYGSPSSGCSTDKGANAISPCATLQKMASKLSLFYSDSSTSACSGANTLANLVSAFGALGQSLQARRLFPNGTT